MRWQLVSVLSLVAGAAMAGNRQPPPSEALRQQAGQLFGAVRAADEAEISASAAVLGRALFWDPRLSADGHTACANCHTREGWGSDPRRVSVAAKGRLTALHAQPVFMAQDQMALRWYGDRRDGAHQAERALTGSMGFDQSTEIVGVLRASGYERAFAAAFPDAGEPLTVGNYARALVSYQRTLRTPSRFDAWLAGDDRALSEQEKAGLEKFIGGGCAGCHSGPLFGGRGFQKFGVVKDYWPATGSATPADVGRFAATKNESDRYVYRVPQLRNVGHTAPYFHDGSVGALEDAVRVMGDVQLGLVLKPEEVADISAFLRALSGAVPEHFAPPVEGVESR